MGDGSHELDIGRLGRYLRSVREARRLSLDAVAEMTLGYPGRVTKSHLSRIENGQAETTFPKMYALSQVYGVPIAAMAETFEIDQRRKTMPRDLAELDDAALFQQANRLRVEGRHVEALVRIELLLDRAARDSGRGDNPPSPFGLQIRQIACLVALDRYHLSRDKCEDLLATTNLLPNQRVLVLHYHARCSYRLSRFTMATMAIERAEQELSKLEDPRPMQAQLAGLKGELAMILGDATAAVGAFHEALSAFTALEDKFEVCRHRMNYGIALGECRKFREARRQLQLALKEARAGSYDRQVGYSLHALGRLALLQGDVATGESWLLESNTIARDRSYAVLVFCNCFYLWKVAEQRQDEVTARAYLRTLRAYVNRVPDSVPEAREFRGIDPLQPGGDV